jgi:opacity protein-like surface antigen
MQKKPWMIMASLFAVTSSAFALNFMDTTDMRPYVGLDAEVRRMDFKGGYGDNLLQHHSPQGNIYAGLKLNDVVGIELGFEATTTRTRTMALTTGDLANGAPISATMSPAVFKSKAKIKGGHTDLVGYYSFYETSPVHLIGSIGAAVLKGTVERRTLSAAGVAMNTTRKLVQHKTVLRLGGGLQYALNENWFARLSIGWVNTSKMVIYADDGITSKITPEVKPKNSTVYGLGMGWIF